MSIARFFNPRLRTRLIVGDVPSWLQRHCRRNYIIATILSTPPWVDRKALSALRIERNQRTQETGVHHHLDHIVPITHPYVCGLTVPWNLQIIPYRANLHKRNKWNPDQLELEL